MPVFNDAENRDFKIVPEDDYIFRVTDFTSGLSKGGKTSGSPNYEADLLLEGQDATIPEHLIDHPSCAWKLDTFLKSAGIQLKKGENYEFQEDKARELDVRFINPIGLRGWCRVRIEEYQKKNGTTGKANKVAIFYTNKEKLPALVTEEDQPFE